MPTHVARRVLEGLLRKLRRLRVKLSCKTWLLKRLAVCRWSVLVGGDSEEDVKRFLELRGVVSERWRGRGVLEEFRRSRGHGGFFVLDAYVAELDLVWCV